MLELRLNDLTRLGNDGLGQFVTRIGRLKLDWARFWKLELCSGLKNLGSFHLFAWPLNLSMRQEIDVTASSHCSGLRTFSRTTQVLLVELPFNISFYVFLHLQFSHCKTPPALCSCKGSFNH